VSTEVKHTSDFACACLLAWTICGSGSEVTMVENTNMLLSRKKYFFVVLVNV